MLSFFIITFSLGNLGNHVGNSTKVRCFLCVSASLRLEYFYAND